jgi:3-hydroxybutyryl-CoA dehydrogenase
LDQVAQTDLTVEKRLALDVVGVVGAGVIGTSVAQSLAQTGHTVLLVDVSDAVLERSLATLRRDLRVFRVLAKSGERPDVEAMLERVRPSTQLADLRRAAFVIENVTEDWELKRDVHQAIDRVCPPACVVAVNTSAIPITRIAESISHGSRMLGMHFMNPVPLKPVVEVVRGEQTSDETLSVALALLSQMGKRAIVVADSPGFVSNRVLMLTINEAAKLVESGVASVHDIDDIFRSCFGHPMGPLETADLIGVDTIVRTLDVLAGALPGENFAACALLRSMVERGTLGRKSGEGFFGYTPPERRTSSP